MAKKKQQKILETCTVDCVNRVYTADYIDAYDDGMPLSSALHKYKSAEERREALLKHGYEEDELDVDVDDGEIGWEFNDYEERFTITVEVIEKDDGTITVRQKL